MKLIDGVVQPYAWGDVDAIPGLLGTQPTGEPQAEYWLGAHASAPSVIEDADASDDGVPANLRTLVADHPEVLGAGSRAEFGDTLPFLLKVLAAAQPLSLQAHPSRAQAEQGFAAENAAGVPLEASNRTYKDDWPKPEMLVALTDFSALCGFRDPVRTSDLFRAIGAPDAVNSVIGPLTQRHGSAGLEEVFLDVLSVDGARRMLVDEVVAAAVGHQADHGEVGEFARTAVDLDERYPSDPGILAALLMNRIELHPGEAIFLPAGNMHAYLKGTGVEIMANSDNVLRGGLTSKHIDVDALVQVVDFAAAPVEVLHPVPEGSGVSRYLTPAPEFALWRLDLAPDQPAMLPGQGRARILLLTDGHVACATADETIELVKGRSAFIAADEVVRLTGSCTAFVAASGV